MADSNLCDVTELPFENSESAPEIWLAEFLNHPVRESPYKTASECRKRVTRRKATEFSVRDGCMFYRGDHLVVFSQDDRRRVLHECHCNDTAGLFGVKKTVDKVRQRYYWPGQYNVQHRQNARLLVLVMRQPKQLSR